MTPLKEPLPPGRTLDQVWHHYEVESAIAARLMSADREGRRRIFATMYDELFAQVPDHPRLHRRDTESMSRAANERKMRHFGPFLKAGEVAMEFAPGDCEFSAMAAKRVRRLIGVDIGDQRASGKSWPDNFELIVYDGSTLPSVAAGSVDVAFSDQFLEHLHPDDTAAHLRLVANALRQGGRYVIQTPNALTGPWDVSRYFSDIAQGFHLKEWTYRELCPFILANGFSHVQPLWRRGSMDVRMPLPVYLAIERLESMVSRRAARRFARWLEPAIIVVATR